MTIQIKTILVDDEPTSLKTLSGILADYCPEIKVISKNSSIEDASLSIINHQPDLIFLDIELPPGGMGFDLLELFPNRLFGVIFSTAHLKYAMKAINDSEPLGYIMKPYNVKQIIKIVQSAKQKIINKSSAINDLDAQRQTRSIVISDRIKGNVIIRLNKVLCCKADLNTTDIYFIENDQLKKITSSNNLKKIEEQLSNDNFCRTHHSTIVNMTKILRYQKTGRNGIIHLPHNQTANISVTKMEGFENKFRKLFIT